MIKIFICLVAKAQNLEQQTKHYWNIAQLCLTNNQKITFFDENQEAFSLDPEANEDAKNEYWQQKGMNDDDIEEFEENALLGDGYPDEYKVFAFNFVITNGEAYSKITSTSLDEIVSLISPEQLQEQLDEEGLSYSGSETEDEVMLILEKRAKKKSLNITEDDLEAATKIAIEEMRNWMDDNYASND